MKERLLMFRNSSFLKVKYILIALTIATIIAGDGYGAEKDKTSKKKATITEAELQSHVMSGPGPILMDSLSLELSSESL